MWRLLTTSSRLLYSSWHAYGKIGVLQIGQVPWTWSIQRSKQFWWKVCVQFIKHLILSSPSNSFKQTAQLSSKSFLSSMSLKLLTTRNSRVTIAETGLLPDSFWWSWWCWGWAKLKIRKRNRTMFWIEHKTKHANRIYLESPVSLKPIYMPIDVLVCVCC